MPALDFVTPFSAADVTPIADLIGDASIVAIGENNHHIHEFGLLRDKLLRHLVEHRGFTVLGFESGFPEGHLVDAWLQGAPGDVADIGRDGFTFSLGDSPEVHGMLTWLREHGGVRFAGLDVPSSGGSPVPSLDAVRAYFAEVDAPAVSLVDAAEAAVKPYIGASNAVAMERYKESDIPQRDAATAALSVLVAHFDALAPAYRQRGGAEAFATALHHAIGALRVDLHLREVTAMMSGTAPELGSSSRDTYMAATVRLLRERSDAKIVLMLHNGHLQRTPFAPLPGSAFPPAGMRLAEEFGDDYFALGLTATTGTTTGLAPQEGTRLGFRSYEQKLDAPAEGSVEEALADAGPCLVDLRAGRAAGKPGPASIRHAHMFTPVDVLHAFDALVHLPRMSVSGNVPKE
ncbi:erythromycin esterase family protein [Amycolatopsis sp. NPDC059027]|uniref:erythromycin esterase family protein n=1 Tax=Amycolatopsis sp. NPDC059027 TaxID=3346709 RepID=UPI00366DFF88